MSRRRAGFTNWAGPWSDRDVTVFAAASRSTSLPGGLQMAMGLQQRLASIYPVLVIGSFHLSSFSRIHSRRASASAGPRPGPVMRSSRT